MRNLVSGHESTLKEQQGAVLFSGLFGKRFLTLKKKMYVYFWLLWV